MRPSARFRSAAQVGKPSTMDARLRRVTGGINVQKRVDRYDELSQWVETFTSGALDIMIIEGAAGTGKSSIVKQSLGTAAIKNHCWIEGRISAVCLYEKLYDHRDLPIYIDDVDGLYRDKECVNILKCLCQTENEKTIMWNTHSRQLKAAREFQTKSKVCIITNSWRMLNKHVGAVQDRGLLIMFHPPADEIHNYVATKLRDVPYVYDDEIYDFIGENMCIIAEPSIRHYRNSLQLKKANMPWKDVLVESFGLNDNQMMVMKLEGIPGLSANQRADEFARRLSKSPRTYWRIRQDLRDRGIRFQGQPD